MLYVNLGFDFMSRSRRDFETFFSSSRLETQLKFKDNVRSWVNCSIPSNFSIWLWFRLSSNIPWYKGSTEPISLMSLKLSFIARGSCV